MAITQNQYNNEVFATSCFIVNTFNKLYKYANETVTNGLCSTERGREAES